MNQLDSCLILQKEPGDAGEGTVSYIPFYPDGKFLLLVEGDYDEGLYRMTQEEVVTDIYIYKNLKGWDVVEVNDQGQALLDQADAIKILGGQ